MDFKTIVIAWIAYLFIKYQHPDFIVNVAVDVLVKIESFSSPLAQFILSAVDFYSANYWIWVATCVSTVLLISYGVRKFRDELD